LPRRADADGHVRAASTFGWKSGDRPRMGGAAAPSRVDPGEDRRYDPRRRCPPFPPVVEAGLPEAPAAAFLRDAGSDPRAEGSPAPRSRRGRSRNARRSLRHAGLATMLARRTRHLRQLAIAHGLLGPTTRVVLGPGWAAAIGVAGLNLRPRSRSFGDTFSRSPRRVHVCAWPRGRRGTCPGAARAGAAPRRASACAGAFALIEARRAALVRGLRRRLHRSVRTSRDKAPRPMLAGTPPASSSQRGPGLGSRALVRRRRRLRGAPRCSCGAPSPCRRRKNAPLFALGLPLVVALRVLPFTRARCCGRGCATMACCGGAASASFRPFPGWRRPEPRSPSGSRVAPGSLLLELADGEPAGQAPRRNRRDRGRTRRLGRGRGSSGRFSARLLLP